MLENYDAILMEGNSEADMNLYYITKFYTLCPFIYVQTRKEKIIVITELELDRAKKEAEVDRVLSTRTYGNRSKVKTDIHLDAMHMLLKELNVHKILVPEYFRIKPYKFLRKKGYVINFKEEPFFEERAIKTEREIGYITEVQRHMEEMYKEIVQILQDSNIKNSLIYYNGNKLTSEDIKKLINVKLMENGIVAQHTIVSCGNDACDPHCEGSGPLRANKSIIIDVFPRSVKTGYFADMTRTFVKGKASEELKRIYDAVKNAQELALDMIKEGVNCSAVNEAVVKYFEKKGYKTGEIEGRMQGFIHGTGHGVGLNIHEKPNLREASTYALKKGNVVTVEPGLYYWNKGSVRIEDLVIVTKTGCRNLTKFPKELYEL